MSSEILRVKEIKNQKNVATWTTFEYFHDSFSPEMILPVAQDFEPKMLSCRWTGRNYPKPFMTRLHLKLGEDTFLQAYLDEVTIIGNPKIATEIYNYSPQKSIYTPDNLNMPLDEDSSWFEFFLSDSYWSINSINFLAQTLRKFKFNTQFSGHSYDQKIFATKQGIYIKSFKEHLTILGNKDSVLPIAKKLYEYTQKMGGYSYDLLKLDNLGNSTKLEFSEDKNTRGGLLRFFLPKA